MGSNTCMSQEEKRCMYDSCKQPLSDWLIDVGGCIGCLGISVKPRPSQPMIPGLSLSVTISQLRKYYILFLIDKNVKETVQ